MEDPFAAHGSDDFLEPSRTRLGGGERLDLPALLLGVAAVHAEEIHGEERGLVTAGSRANFENRVLFVVGIARQEQQPDLLLERLAARLEGLELALGQLAQLGVALGEHAARAVDLPQHRAVRLRGPCGWAQSGQLLGDARVFARIRGDPRVSERLLEPLGPGRKDRDLLQEVRHDGVLRSGGDTVKIKENAQVTRSPAVPHDAPRARLAGRPRSLCRADSAPGARARTWGARPSQPD